MFVDSLPGDIAEGMKDPEYRARWYEIQNREHASLVAENEALRGEVAKWHALCDPQGLVRHHRGNAGLAAALEESINTHRAQREVKRLRSEIEALAELWQAGWQMSPAHRLVRWECAVDLIDLLATPDATQDEPYFSPSAVSSRITNDAHRHGLVADAQDPEIGGGN